MSAHSFPRMARVRQRFPHSASVDVRAAITSGWKSLAPALRPGMRVAVAVGSRGITNLKEIVRCSLDQLRAAGAQPYIVPSMGSHGGATPEGQTELLAEYGVTEAAMGVPIRAAMEVERIGATPDGVDVFCSAEALKADGILVINRVKPHTDFVGTIGSGILKMMVIGLGKRAGAANFHLASSRLGYEHVLRTSARVTLIQTPILGGIAILENQAHATAKIEVIPPASIEARENELFVEAKQLMPRLPFDDIDLLIVDFLGKNISGAGMDPNIIGRSVHGYSSLLADTARMQPVIRRIFVRGLTPETHGNAIGIGMADVTTSRLARGIDSRVTAVNSLTALTPQSAKVPITFECDRDAISAALTSIFPDGHAQARIVRIQDTLSLEHVELSEAYADQMGARADLEAAGAYSPIQFDAEGNLPPLNGH